MPSAIVFANDLSEALHAKKDTPTAHFVSLSVVDKYITTLHRVTLGKWAQITEQIGCRQRLGACLQCSW